MVSKPDFHIFPLLLAKEIISEQKGRSRASCCVPPRVTNGSVPLVLSRGCPAPSRGEDWGGCPWGQVWPPQGYPGAVPVPPCPRGRGSARWACGCPPHGMGNRRTINFHRSFFQEKAGVWSVPAHLAHRHLPPVSPPVPRAPPGPRPPVPRTRGSSMGPDEPSRTPGPPRRAHQSSPAQGLAQHDKPGKPKDVAAGDL